MDEIIDVEMLFVDGSTGRMFHASQKDIETAKDQINKLIALNGHVTMEDYVKALGLYNRNCEMVSDMYKTLVVKDGPIEFIMDATESWIKLNINKNWVMISQPWDS